MIDSCSLQVRRMLFVAVLFSALCAAGGCGAASSIAEGFIDDQQFTLFPSVDRSGAVVRTDDGQDVEVRPGNYTVGDTLTGNHSVAVFAFQIDASQAPEGAELKHATLIFWTEPQSGEPAPLGPIVVSHLPAHPNFPLVAGQVPHPAGSTIQEQGELAFSGWRRIDVTAAFRTDFYGGRAVSAFAVRLSGTTNSDLRADTIALTGTDPSGDAARAHLVLEFGADL